TAVDFRAGLTLLPFLPMSPGDFGLIWRGLKRGSLVQFDRGDLNKLEKFVAGCGDDFADMKEMLEELKSVEDIYRNSVPDITHNHFRLLYSGKLWSTMFDSAVGGWKVRNIVDERTAGTLANSKLLTMLFWMLGVIPFLGRFLRRLWGRGDWVEHYGALLGSWDYVHAAVRGHIAEKVIKWYRAGRLNGEHSIEVAESSWLFICHIPFSILPAGLHRFLTDGRFAKEKLASIFVRPVKLYFSASLREQWLRDMASEGRKKHILTDEDSETILSQLNEPFIQKYLVSLAVHIMTLPVTQVVGVIISIANKYMNDLSWPQAFAQGALIMGTLQIVPISPGSICRGLWTVFMAVRDRDFKNYNIAIFLSFFKYIGYLAFPIQMANHYPAMARFMAGHWATDATHIVPVFGERGALLEHWVFCLFYNWPLTVRRRMAKRRELRLSQGPRYWHVGLVAIVAVGIFSAVEYLHLREPWMPSEFLGLRQIWWLAFLLPFACGSLVTLGCGGASLAKRFVAGAFCGVAIGLLSVLASVILGRQMGTAEITVASAGLMCVWRVFAFTVFSTMGAIVAELKLPDPDLG
ncbi:MAG: hypothetical protein KAT00_05555, partial [Planctomycetes bacterium]|nr:hypothetical protein [Planctomycetota bacterium]